MAAINWTVTTVAIAVLVAVALNLSGVQSQSPCDDPLDPACMPCDPAEDPMACAPPCDPTDADCVPNCEDPTSPACMTPGPGTTPTTTTTMSTNGTTSTTSMTTTTPRGPADVCTGGGYFVSKFVPGGFFLCQYAAQIRRWLLFPMLCPTGQEFNEGTGVCVATPTTAAPRRWG